MAARLVVRYHIETEIITLPMPPQENAAFVFMTFAAVICMRRLPVRTGGAPPPYAEATGWVAD